MLDAALRRCNRIMVKPNPKARPNMTVPHSFHKMHEDWRIADRSVEIVQKPLIRSHARNFCPLGEFASLAVLL